MLLGHPHPIHRRIAWSTSLDDVESVEVQQLASVRELVKTTTSLPQGVTLSTIAVQGGYLPSSYSVQVDGMEVFRGTPLQCEKIQSWIGDSRARHHPQPGDQPLRTR
jgi:hypothetical protein